MKVYLVMTKVMTSNIAEVACKCDGVYLKKTDAKKKFNEIKKEWKEWAKGDEVEICSGPECFLLTNFDTDEYMELHLVEKEVQ